MKTVFNNKYSSVTLPAGCFTAITLHLYLHKKQFIGVRFPALTRSHMTLLSLPWITVINPWLSAGARGRGKQPPGHDVQQPHAEQRRVSWCGGSSVLVRLFSHQTKDAGSVLIVVRGVAFNILLVAADHNLHWNPRPLCGLSMDGVEQSVQTARHHAALCPAWTRCIRVTYTCTAWWRGFVTAELRMCSSTKSPWRCNRCHVHCGNESETIRKKCEVIELNQIWVQLIVHSWLIKTFYILSFK